RDTRWHGSGPPALDCHCSLRTAGCDACAQAGGTMTDLAGPKVLTEERVAHIMKTLYLFHDVWTHYPKADWLAAHYPVEGFVVIKKTRPWFGKYLWKRSRRLGFPKVLDELAFRLYWRSEEH